MILHVQTSHVASRVQQLKVRGRETQTITSNLYVTTGLSQSLLGTPHKLSPVKRTTRSLEWLKNSLSTCYGLYTRSTTQSQCFARLSSDMARETLKRLHIVAPLPLRDQLHSGPSPLIPSCSLNPHMPAFFLLRSAPDPASRFRRGA